MRIGFRSPDDLTGLLIDRENDGAISRSATQSTRRGPWGEPAKAVNQPHIASDNEQVSFDIRCVAGALRYKTRDREIVHVILSPDQLPRESVQLGQVTGNVIEIEMRTVDGRSGRDAAQGITCRSRVGRRLVDPLDPQLTHGLFVDRPPSKLQVLKSIPSANAGTCIVNSSKVKPCQRFMGGKLSMNASEVMWKSAAMYLQVKVYA